MFEKNAVHVVFLCFVCEMVRVTYLSKILL